MHIIHNKIPYHRKTSRTNHSLLGHISERDDYRIAWLRQSILYLLAKDPSLSIGRLAIKLNTNVNTIKYHIRYLQANRSLERIGSKYHGIWVVKSDKKRNRRHT